MIVTVVPATEQIAPVVEVYVMARPEFGTADVASGLIAKVPALNGCDAGT
jgi:hypothetical protein